MPLWGILNSLFGHQDDGIQQQAATPAIARQPDHDGFTIQQQGQQQQVSAQQVAQLHAQLQSDQFHRQAQQRRQQSSYGFASQLDLNTYGQQLAYVSEMMKHHYVYDTSWETTKKSCDTIAKAIESLALLKAMK